MATDSTVQLTPQTPASVDNASTGKFRVFWNSLTNLLVAKNDVGAIIPIGGGAFVHNAVVVGPAVVAAVIQETKKCDPTLGAITVNLPLAAGSTGQQVKVVNVTNSVTPITVAATGGEQILDAGGALSASVALNTPRESVLLESDGTKWVVV